MHAHADDRRATAQQAAASMSHALSTWMAAPFDAMRWAYGGAVQCGLTPRSMLASREVERTLGALEHLTLGPFARHA